MNVQRGKLVSGGRLQLPVRLRRALSPNDGDTVLLEIVDGEIRVRPLKDAVTRSAGLSLGDRACLAAAVANDAVAMTTDQSWRALDFGISVEFAR